MVVAKTAGVVEVSALVVMRCVSCANVVALVSPETNVCFTVEVCVLIDVAVVVAEVAATVGASSAEKRVKPSVEMPAKASMVAQMVIKEPDSLALGSEEISRVGTTGGKVKLGVVSVSSPVLSAGQ